MTSVLGIACGSSSEGAAGSMPVVAVVQSPSPRAADLTSSDVAGLVNEAVSRAGGLGFIRDGQTVVLKPNLVTFYEDDGEHTLSVTANGVATDWRVVKAVADLVRAKNPTGEVLVMEGSRILTAAVFPVLGYTSENFGRAVDELVGIEGPSCAESTMKDLQLRTAESGKQYWVNPRYMNADVIIAIPTLATDAATGIGGALTTMGIGGTPAPAYDSGTSSVDCTRTKIDESHPATAGAFIRDYYGLRPADFVVVDGLQGLQHGPLPVWDDSGRYDYASSIMNMRLVLAGRDAVAVDSVSAAVMRCLPAQVPQLAGLESLGRGRTDLHQIEVVGAQVEAVARPFQSKQTTICPGH